MFRFDQGDWKGELTLLFERITKLLNLIWIPPIQIP